MRHISRSMCGVCCVKMGGKPGFTPYHVPRVTELMCDVNTETKFKRTEEAYKAFVNAMRVIEISLESFQSCNDGEST